LEGVRFVRLQRSASTGWPSTVIRFPVSQSARVVGRHLQIRASAQRMKRRMRIVPLKPQFRPKKDGRQTVPGGPRRHPAVSVRAVREFSGRSRRAAIADPTMAEAAFAR
jgi:hypothetical protein